MSERINMGVRETASRQNAWSSFGTTDHRKLLHRGDSDQHPISSITGLQDELDARPDSELTNSEIEELLI